MVRDIEEVLGSEGLGLSLSVAPSASALGRISGRQCSLSLSLSLGCSLSLSLSPVSGRQEAPYALSRAGRWRRTRCLGQAGGAVRPVSGMQKCRTSYKRQMSPAR